MGPLSNDPAGARSVGPLSPDPAVGPLSKDPAGGPGKAPCRPAKAPARADAAEGSEGAPASRVSLPRRHRRNAPPTREKGSAYAFGHLENLDGHPEKMWGLWNTGEGDRGNLSWGFGPSPIVNLVGAVIADAVARVAILATRPAAWHRLPPKRRADAIAERAELLAWADPRAGWAWSLGWCCHALACAGGPFVDAAAVARLVRAGLVSDGWSAVVPD